MKKQKKMTIDLLGQLVEERAQGIEEKMATKELVVEVLALVKNIDEGINNIKTNKASFLDVARTDLRVDALEKDMKRVKEKMKL